MVAKELWVFDLDRTLIDAVRADDLLLDVCQERGIDAAQLRESQQQVESTGGSFDTIEYLRGMGSSTEQLDDICEQFVLVAQQDAELLFADALPLLELLQAHQVPTLIMTYGSSQWQIAKVRGAGLDAFSWLVVPTKDKGRAIADWRGDDGLYGVQSSAGASLVAGTVVLVDDKAVSFQDLPTDCKGYWLQRDGLPLLPSQQGEVGDNVGICSTLNGLEKLLS